MLTEKGPLLPQEKLLIVYFIAVLLFFTIFAITVVIAFQRRKNSFLKERYEAEQRYQRELADSKIEIQEQTLKNIAWELHDNVGQLLSVANIQLNVLMSTVPETYHNQIKETKEVVQETVQEIRSLSKVLNNDVVLKNGLLASLQVELDRFKRLGYLDASLKISGDIIPLNSSSEIIIFRILQEFLSNVIKHAKASKLFVHLDYKERALAVTAVDDGVGFNTSVKTDSSGMETMGSRAALLNADFSIVSEIGKGTELFLSYPYKNTI
ncbi:sensor histidine kinase [Aequorivita lipolytica]|uniref:histidine kinase n=1 Tax=Aequorivita lipolytica TaxID=153267 RepID=A0A5C6YQ92_9FLAO|nr:histidine kinase [Aequorivita lipolytica]TXD69639.1 histidine kinase [Aequorivita lipolytica]SRX51130.1 Sensor histidine kinase LiaS [Aequorivita lipolytica]